jgi:leader peptidase (prepilin peptidase) / N-methyltransferase
MDQAIRSGLLIGVSAVLSAINFRTGVIPNRITLPALAVGLLTSLVMEHPGPASALLGVVVGGGMVLALTVVMRGRIGGGVTKMAAMVGALAKCQHPRVI